MILAIPPQLNLGQDYMDVTTLILVYCSFLLKKGIPSYWSTKKESFSKGLIIYKNNIKKDNIQWIYDCAKSNVPIETVLKTMKIA